MSLVQPSWHARMGWRRRCQDGPNGCPYLRTGGDQTTKVPSQTHIIWLNTNTVQRDLRTHNLALHEAVDLAQNRPLWRPMSIRMALRTPRGPWQKRSRRSHDMVDWSPLSRLLTAPLPTFISLSVTVVLHWQDLIEVFKMCRGLSRLKLNELFTLANNIRGTRRHSWKLVKFRCTRDCCKYFSLIE